MATRSRRLFGPTGLVTAGATLYTTPADRVAVLRAIYVTNVHASGAPKAYFYVNGLDALDEIWRGTLALNTALILPGVVILDPGDTLEAAASIAGAVVATGFGSLLAGAPA